jgi:hypothetical protein
MQKFASLEFVLLQVVELNESIIGIPRAAA